MDETRGEQRPSREERIRLGTQLGLCADCVYTRAIDSVRGHRFYLCERAAFDSTFPKYPNLPVTRCSGYEPVAAPGARD